MSIAPYFWHPRELAENTDIGQCANCVNLKKSNVTAFNLTCNTTTYKPLADPSRPDHYVSCDSYANTKAVNWYPDVNEMQSFNLNLTYLMITAYLLPPGVNYTTSKSNPNYTSIDFVKEACRITNIFLINNDTKMNPNMNYG